MPSLFSPIKFFTLFFNLIYMSCAQNQSYGDQIIEIKEVLHLIINYDAPENKALMKEKSALRYGWQNTKECGDFGKAFICVRKCLDLNYDTAYSNKTCDCTCFKVQDLQKHKSQLGPPRDTYLKGYPKTKKPYWIQGNVNPDTTREPDTTTADDDSGDEDSDDEGSGGSGSGQGPPGGDGSGPTGDSGDASGPTGDSGDATTTPVVDAGG